MINKYLVCLITGIVAICEAHEGLKSGGNLK